MISNSHYQNLTVLTNIRGTSFSSCLARHFTHHWSGARLTKADDVTIQRYRNSHAKIENSKNAYFAVYGFKILCEISKVPFEISHKNLNPYTAKYAFYEVLKVWRLTISYTYDILGLSETGPRPAWVTQPLTQSLIIMLADDLVMQGARASVGMVYPRSHKIFQHPLGKGQCHEKIHLDNACVMSSISV